MRPIRRTPTHAQIRRIAQERLGLAVDFLPVSEMPPPGPKPFFSLLDQALSEEISRRIAKPFWIDTVGPLGAGRDPHQARRHGDARVRPPQRRLCVELRDLPALDGRHLAGAADRRDPVPAQPDPADPAARRRRRELRQGPRRAELPPARRARGAARGRRLHRDEEAASSARSSSAPPCWPASRTTCAPS